MGIDNLDDPRAPDRSLRRSSAVQGTSSPIGNSSVSEGALEIRSNEGLIVAGSAKVSGTLAVTGTETVAGTLIVTGTERVDGTLRVTGHFIVDGDQTVNGPLVVAGTFTITGATTLTGNLTVNSPGKITVAGGSSPATLQNGQLAFGTGGVVEADVTNGGVRMIVGTTRVYVGSGIAAVQAGLNSVAVTPTQTTVTGTTVVNGSFSVSGGSKSFRMDHPTKPGKWLYHGSTESPVSGIEYWGEGNVDDSGTVSVDLPEYFEALAKPDGRVVLVTGRGFAADWTDIEDGSFLVSGPANRRFSWLVKAERLGGDFELEADQILEPVPVEAEGVNASPEPPSE